MVIGILSEPGSNEDRVGLTPAGVRSLSLSGHEIFVESGAGASAYFSDEEYLAAGARVVYDREEIFGRADLVAKVSALAPEDVPHLREGQAILAFHHLAASRRELMNALVASRATLIGYEVIGDRSGDLPILHAMSEIAGQLAVYVAAHHLGTGSGGRGILLGGATGIPPAHVVILGAGSVGRWAAKTAAGNRAQVTVLDTSLPALRRIEESLGTSVITEIAHPVAVHRATSYADVLIGAVLVRGERAPIVITREMVAGMKAGSVIVDVSIDQGGCVETSRPTTLRDPAFSYSGVTHVAVPNMTSAVARTASFALTHAVLPCIHRLAALGVESALDTSPDLAAGVYVHRGELISESVGRSFDVPTVPLRRVLALHDRTRRAFVEGML
jgi:alanine dehydrogenase